MTQDYSAELKTVIDEFKNVSPEVTSALIFKMDGGIVVSSEAVTKKQTKTLIASFCEMADQAESMGDIENLTVQGANRQLSIRNVNNRYLATVSSKAADEKVVKTFTRVIIPTVVKLVDQISELSSDEAAQDKKNEVTQDENARVPKQTSQDESTPDVSASFCSEHILPEPPVNQFIIEKIGGLLVPSDIARVDSEVIAKWHEIYGKKEITQIHIETLEGKAILCGFRPIKEANQAKGVIQFPEKIMQALQTSKGKLVIVKPVITAQGEKAVEAKNK